MKITLSNGREYTHKQCTDALFLYLVRQYIDPFSGDLSSTFRDEAWSASDIHDALSMSVEREEREGGDLGVVLEGMITASGGYVEAYAFAGELVNALAEEIC